MNFLASLFGNQNQTKMTTSEERVKNENKIKNEELLDMQIPVIVNENKKKMIDYSVVEMKDM